MTTRHLAAAAAIACTSGMASAHHSTAEFDYTRELRVEGTVERYLWTNPHMWLHVRVTRPGGEIQIYRLETGAPNVNARMGWRQNSLKAGDRVVVAYCPNRDGSPRGSITTVTLPDGSSLRGVAYGFAQRQRRAAQ